ncbi:MAG: tRNA pseudouridine(38-40) synthase TruA [candidate division Zixibacteria bacterium]|jgi:tRNA pseudouridine38-40 synthase|nr:tRNA pseudouridine(38-40) synthase TruA [candidate division Zixibacteria bacterium]
MPNFKLTIEYDGTGFSGWQVQPGLRTVQGEIEKALENHLGYEVKITGGGRTDAGVHALGQTASFKADIDWGADAVRKAINGVLPDDILIVDCSEVGDDFNARFSALSRHYRYQIYSDRSSLRRNLFWCYEDKLDFDLLQTMASYIRGEHDFASFCVKKSQKPSNLCRVEKSYWTNDGKEFTFQIISNRFLHGMVRSLVGSMIKVNAGSLELFEFKDLIDNPERSEKVLTAPANGLYLVEIRY